MKYHPYRPIRRQELKPEDLPRRIQFCTWIRTLTNNQLGKLVFSDKAYFELNGSVNSQKVRRYAPLKSSDPVNGGRPAHFIVEKPTFPNKLMVFCGVKVDGTFGMKVQKSNHEWGSIPFFVADLQFTALPELEIRNGGNLNTLWWQQDGTPCHVTDHNMRYLDFKFEGRVVSRRAIRGHDWPAR